MPSTAAFGDPLTLAPDGDGRAAPGVSIAGERTPLGAALSTLPFWHLGGALFTCGFSMSLIASHGVPMLTDHGYHPMMASWALAVLGASSMAGAMVLGFVGDRLGRRPVLAWLYGSRMLLFAGLFYLLHLANRKREAFLDRWVQEHADDLRPPT